jgi:hypothetical protein
MKSISFSATLAVLLLSLAVVSAFGAGYSPDPVVPTIPQPPVLLVPGEQITGLLCFFHANGSNMTLAEPLRMTLRACPLSGGCSTITVVLEPAFNKTGCCYRYAMNTTLPGFPTGEVKLYIIADSMRDMDGTAFPTVDTLIGTVLVTPAPAPSSASSHPPSVSSPVKATSNNKPPRVFRDAEAASQESKAAKPPPSLIPTVLAFLAVAGAMMVVIPRRKQ